MGTAPSKEAPGQAPNKLSKPRTVNYPAAGLLNSNGSSSNPPARRFSSAGLVGQRYSSYPNSSPVAPSASEIGDDIAEDQEDRENESTLASPRPMVQRRRSLFRSKSSQYASERRTSRRNTIIGAPTSIPDAQRTMPRSHSMTAHDARRDSYYGPPVTEK